MAVDKKVVNLRPNAKMSSPSQIENRRASGSVVLKPCARRSGSNADGRKELHNCAKSEVDY